MENLYLILLLIVLGYFALYFSGRKYLEQFNLESNESFKENFTNRFNKDGTPITDATMIQSSTLPENAYSMDQRDTYEVSQVFNNQGSKTASKQQLSDAMTQYPMEWSAQGSNSQYFQENQEKYLKNKNRVNPEPYQNEAVDMLLPDSAALDDEERKILQTYVPESSKGLLHYSTNDVKHLLYKIYGKKGLIPVIEKSKQGENIWEIVEVKEKNPKIVWEDDVKEDRREDTIDVPYTVSDIAAGLNPFGQCRDRVRTGGFDIKENTELDRMFQPTYPIPEWN